MFSIYLYLVLILIIIVILYLTHDQFIISIKEKKELLETQTIPIVKSDNLCFVPSKDQQI